MRILLTLFLIVSLPLFAQSTNATEEITNEVKEDVQPPPTVEEMTARLDLEQIIENGGPLVYLLAAMSVLAFALVLYFVVTLNTSRIAPAAFVREMQLLLKSGDMEEARALCEKQSSPVAELVKTAFDYLDRAGDHADPELLRQVVEGEGVRQVGRLQSQVTYLMDIGVIAPMIGLLGTVMGMLRSFSTVALNIAKVKPMELADGVSQALITTAAGLCVAIPAMIAYSIFRGRLAKLTANMEMVAADVVTTLVHRNQS